MGICPSVQLNSTADLLAMRDWASSAFDMMAMGNYPYPSSYMLNGGGELPAFPMRVACEKMMYAVQSIPPVLNADRGLGRKAIRGLRSQEIGLKRGQDSGVSLLRGLSGAIGVWYNFTGAPCSR